MAFKLAVLFATLAYVSAGAIESDYLDSYAVPVAHYASAPAVSYSSITRTHSPTIAYAAPAYGYAYSQAYGAPIAHSYPAQTLDYAQNYAPALSYTTPLAAFKHAINPVLDARTYGYDYSTPSIYNNYGHSAY